MSSTHNKVLVIYGQVQTSWISYKKGVSDYIIIIVIIIIIVVVVKSTFRISYKPLFTE